MAVKKKKKKKISSIGDRGNVRHRKVKGSIPRPQREPVELVLGLTDIS